MSLIPDVERDAARRHLADARAILDGDQAAAERAAGAAAARDAAMQRVAENAGADWQLYARRFIREYLETHESLFAEDLRDAGLEPPPNGEERALGPALKWCADNGLMERTGETRPSTKSHLQHRPVWRSLVYRAAVEQEAMPL